MIEPPPVDLGQVTSAFRTVYGWKRGVQPASGGIYQGDEVPVPDPLYYATRRRRRLGCGYQVRLRDLMSALSGCQLTDEIFALARSCSSTWGSRTARSGADTPRYEASSVPRWRSVTERGPAHHVSESTQHMDLAKLVSKRGHFQGLAQAIAFPLQTTSPVAGLVGWLRLFPHPTIVMHFFLVLYASAFRSWR